MGEQANTSGGVMNCGDIQTALFDYMTHELGQAQSDLVREHLRKCPDCQAEAVRIRHTLELLKEASRSDSSVPKRLSDDRRARMLYAFMHPVLDWVYAHHILVSIIVTTVALLLLFGTLRNVKAWRTGRLERGVQVLIGTPED